MVTRLGVIATLLVVTASPLLAQQKVESEEEKNARLARQGAGLRVGIWQVKDLATGDESDLFFEGYMTRGMDLHLVIESSAGLWRNKQTLTRDGGPLSADRQEEITTYLVPLLTSIKFIPTKPGAAVEPYLTAGVGFAIGVGESAGASGLLGSGGGTEIITGFGGKVGGGVEFKMGSAFALTASARYQLIKLQDNLGSDDNFKGLGFEGGLRYRFQY